MAKDKIRASQNFGYVGNGENIVSQENRISINRSSIIIKIKSVYSSYSEIMSLEDQKQLLDMLKEIEQTKKDIENVGKMFIIVSRMRQKYRDLEKHYAEHFSVMVEKQR